MTSTAENTIEKWKFKFVIGGHEKRIPSRDPIVEARKILSLAGLEPADEYVLIELQHPGTRSVGLDEEVDLREQGREEFWAFPSDRTFNFTVNDRGYEWGAAIITEAELRLVSKTPDEKDLVLERKDVPDEVIAKGSTVDLDASGMEHIHARKRPDTFGIIVNYNGQKKPLNVTVTETISAVLARAIAHFGTLPNPHTLSLHTADKGELKDEWTVKIAGLTPQEEVLLRPSTVKAGE